MNIVEAISDPRVFGPAFRDAKSWVAWRAFLAALFGLPMDEAQRGIFSECTSRADAPTEVASEAWLVCGRRAGKSFTLALVAEMVFRIDLVQVRATYSYARDDPTEIGSRRRLSAQAGVRVMR
jgi:hypothetical protein